MKTYHLCSLAALLPVWFIMVEGVGAEAPKAAITLIQLAGNANTDEARLAILNQLNDSPDINAQLKSETTSLVNAIEEWVDYRNLTYFGREVGGTVDFDFHISRESPLYPLTCFYRGRMLTWITLESGNIIRYPDRRREFLGKAVKNFEIARAAFTENRIARMYLGEAIPNKKRYTAPGQAPEWAVWQRENLERLTDIITWWIDFRMQSDGQFGGGWGDDCEMWRWWAPVLIGFDDAKITAAQTRFSEAMMSQSHMRGGYTSRMTDVEHTAEDSADVITPMMTLEPHNPIWKNRALRLAELMENLWTGINQRGFLQFKSTYFTFDQIDQNPQRACDTVYHPRALQPTLLLWQRTADPKLGALFHSWMNTWVDATARAENGKPAGIPPSAIHWPDGGVGGRGKDWWDPQNHGEPTLYQWPSALSMLNDTLLLTYHMTKNEKYLAPLRSMARIRLKYLKNPPEDEPIPGTESWCAARLGLLAGTLAKYKTLTGSAEFDELLTRDDPTTIVTTEDGSHDEWGARLRDSALALQVNFAGYTSEVRWTDRVLRFPVLFDKGMLFENGVPGFKKPDPLLIYALVTGDPGASGYFPMNAVRWGTTPRNIAALVTDSTAEKFSAELFHFGTEPRPMSAELYLLAPGSYHVTFATKETPEADEEIFQHRQLDVTGPVPRLTFTLQPQRLVVIRIKAGK